MGTGVGGAILINGKLHSGRTNIGGEWGHHTLHRNGNPCYCGKTGCVETYISGPSLEKRWFELTGKSQSMPEILSNLNDEISQKWKCEFLENFGYGLANVIDILDPDVIVLGGGLSNIDLLYTEGKESVYEKINNTIVDLGCKFSRPHLIPLFLPFLALPSVRILSGGIVDVKKRRYISPIN